MEFGPEVVAKTKNIHAEWSPSSDGSAKFRQTAYKVYKYERHGVIGNNQPIQIPHCVLEGIRKE